MSKAKNKKKSKNLSSEANKRLADNRYARHQYEILEKKYTN